jgi:hypothetical protein
MRRGSTTESLLKGAIAGAVATWAMGRVTNYLYQREGRSARRAEDEARHDRTAYEIAAEQVAGVLGRTLSEAERSRLGNAIHWALGIGAGVAYAVLGRRNPRVRRAAGTAFGTGFWATIDEGLVSLLRLTPPPKAFPWQTHARGLAGHLAFGAVTDGTIRLLDAIA